jgi:hypothetical protein
MDLMYDDELEANMMVGFCVLLVIAMTVGFVVFAITDPIGALVGLAIVAAIPLGMLLLYGIGSTVTKWMGR